MAMQPATRLPNQGPCRHAFADLLIVQFDDDTMPGGRRLVRDAAIGDAVGAGVFGERVVAAG